MKLARGRRTAGAALMAASLLGGLLAAPSAIAAEGDEVPEDAEQIEPTRQAFWNADRSKYAHNSATSQFPPQAVCLVQPRACFFPEGEDDPSGELGLGTELNDRVQSTSQQEQELLATIGDAEEGDDADPVQEGDLPVSVAFGENNYRSAIQFELPPLPDGQIVESFTVVLTEGQPTYSNESPAFRQAVLAALTCASENEEPQGRCTREEFEKVPAADLRGDAPLEVEACPIVGEWSEGRSQDEDTLPEVNCLYTTAGVPVPVGDDTFWVFDLALIAQAWYDGKIAENGLLLAPGSAENLAYGDPEQTYSKQVTFTPPIQLAMTTEPEPEPPPAPPAPLGPTGSTFTGGSGDVFGTPPAPSSGGFVTPPSTPSQPATDQAPEVSEPAETAPPQTEEPTTLAAGTPLGEPETPWWLWLLVPMFLAGAWLLSRSLEEQGVAASERSGAMTRLLERRTAASSGGLVTG